MTHSLSRFAACFALLACCTSDSEQKKPAAQVPTTPDVLPADAYVAAYAKLAARCRPGPVDSGAYANLKADIEENLAAPGITQQTLDAFAACAKALATAGCGAEPEACLGDFPGALADGSGCISDAQCASGRCINASGTQCGSCAPQLSLGADCRETYSCGTGMLCSGSSSPVCAARAIAGEGQTCSDVVACAQGLRCSGTSTATVCRALVAPGGSCAGGLGCDEGGHYYCDQDFICSLRPAAGASCAVTACTSGLICDGTSRTCRTPKSSLAADQACEVGDQCAAGLGCSRSSGDGKPRRCIAYAQMGQDCTTSVCADGLVCSGIGTASPRCAARTTAANCN